MNTYIAQSTHTATTNVQQIKTYLDQIATISNSDWEFFTSKLQRREIPKKAIFLKLKPK